MSRWSGASVLCVAFVAAACGGTPAGDQRGGPIDSGTVEALDWTTYELPEAGLTVSYPSSWLRAPQPLMPMLWDPRELVALSTFAARPGGENCAHMPENAVADMGPTDALVVVEERFEDPEPGSGTLADYPERPTQFGPADGYRSAALDCLDRPKALFDRFIPFRASGRGFYAYVAFGNETPQAVRDQAWAILDRLEIEARGEP